QDITALAAYQNVRGRLGWGVSAQQVPYLTGGYSVFGDVVGGTPVLVEERLLIRQTNRQLAGQIMYPFSTVQRVELIGGYRNITFDRELRTRFYDPTGSVLLDEFEEDLDSPSALNLGEGAAALVYDNSFFGATSPILGQRYRLEVNPMFGSLNLVNAIVDFRRYFMPVRPFTLAFRALHYGRYGGDSEDQRLNPLYLGYDGLVRGYRVGSFSAEECEPVAGDPNACPVFDQLIGSRILVGNAELRFPLFGALGIGSGYYGVFPLELAIFGDAGVAWTANEEPQFAGGTRDIVTSAGASARINLLGFLIAEVSLVRPFERPEKGWMWQFALQPGF
ncbi:MAG: BamA/TamA family outer membrane protein, partial [Gemmatimonadota bacterium]|nr:BamA/TamA family outer membrane protein [Gemmatimonadota bacterium]